MRSALPLLAALAAPVVLAAGVAHAGCTSGCKPCCTAPTTHTVTVPGITVIPPTVYIQPQKIVGGVGGYGDGGFGAVVDVSVSSTSSASAYADASGYAASLAASIAQSSAYAAGSSSALATANSQAQNLLAASGGSSSFFSEGASNNGAIPNLVVVTNEAPAAAPVCLERRAVAKAVAIQAVCLDDKAVPHPASQVSPERDVTQAYVGELFRCLAGSHMQYVLADFAGQARFDHGQTVVCQKNEALWRGMDGRLQCRPQAPARDCNERSLLRRYGAGIKVVASAAEQCVRWSGPVAAEATAASGQSFTMDGGVGGGG